MMLHGSRPQSPSTSTATTTAATTPGSNNSNGFAHDASPSRKRKAGSQDNERLSKRLSLLNIGIHPPCQVEGWDLPLTPAAEQKGSKLYVPVEEPSKAATKPSKALQPAPSPDDSMQLDDSKHKVYIYNIDDELSDDDDTDDEKGKLIFLPDIEKHLRESRIPPQVLANSAGELAGMQVVLYSDPKSLSVPEEKDGVRKAIIEARQRAREKQPDTFNGVAEYAKPPAPPRPTNADPSDDEAMDID